MSPSRRLPNTDPIDVKPQEIETSKTSGRKNMSPRLRSQCVCRQHPSSPLTIDGCSQKTGSEKTEKAPGRRKQRRFAYGFTPRRCRRPELFGDGREDELAPTTTGSPSRVDRRRRRVHCCSARTMATRNERGRSRGLPA